MPTENRASGNHRDTENKEHLNNGSDTPERSPDSGGSDNREYGNLRRHPLELKIPPVVVFGFFAAVMWTIAVYFPVFAVDIPFHLTITVFLFVVGIATGLYSIYLFLRIRTTVHAHKPSDSRTLLTTGPYKHTRNPMYLSLSIVLIAWAIFLSDLLALMLMPAFYGYMTRFQIIPEERELAEKFGEEYRDYAERTPRWL